MRAASLGRSDYFAVKLVQLTRRLDQRPLPRRFRALSFGPEHVTVQRTAANTLELEYAEGILSSPFMELYRDRRIAMTVGQRIELEGMTIEVRELTSDGRARKVSSPRTIATPATIRIFPAASRCRGLPRSARTTC